MSLMFVVLFSTGFPLSTSAAPELAPDLILAEGSIWTGDPSRPEAQALAIVGEHLHAVGSNEEILKLAGRTTRILRVGGRRVIPGFIDAHVHFLEGGDELLAPDLRSAESEEEMARRLGEAARRVSAGTWLVSGAWDHENWPGAPLPTRRMLDKYTPRHPVFVSRLDGHMALANSLAIRIAGVTAATADPPGGEIVREPGTGEPSGVFKDAAMGLISRHVPSRDAEARRERALAALKHAASLGITGVHDMGTTPEDLQTFQKLQGRGRLTLRITAYCPAGSLKHWKALGLRRGFGSNWIRLNGLKAFADGSLGSSTALFYEPYLQDATDTDEADYGLAQMDLSEGGDLEGLARDAVASGLQLAVHAIGDRAIGKVLDMHARIRSRLGAAGLDALRFRIEHAQHIHPRDLNRFAELEVIASMQPSHVADDGRWAEKRIGQERCETTYAFRDLLDRGVTLAFGSDWPVAPLSPLRGIEAATTRQTLDGRNPGGWIPRQKITAEEALRAYTLGSARAACNEDRVGSIRVGCLADLVVLAEDILAIEPERIGDVAVDYTLVGGRVVFERPR